MATRYEDPDVILSDMRTFEFLIKNVQIKLSNIERDYGSQMPDDLQQSLNQLTQTMPLEIERLGSIMDQFEDNPTDENLNSFRDLASELTGGSGHNSTFSVILDMQYRTEIDDPSFRENLASLQESKEIADANSQRIPYALETYIRPPSPTTGQRIITQIQSMNRIMEAVGKELGVGPSEIPEYVDALPPSARSKFLEDVLDPTKIAQDFADDLTTFSGRLTMQFGPASDPSCAQECGTAITGMTIELGTVRGPGFNVWKR